jgi:K+-sensing histidine kinase KdpD
MDRMAGYMQKRRAMAPDPSVPGKEGSLAPARLNSARVVVAFAVIGLVDVVYLSSHELRQTTPMSLFYIGVLISTIAGGVIPGLVAIVLGFFSSWYLNITQEFTFDLNLDVVTSLLVYLLTAVAVFLVAWRLLIAEGRSISLLDWLFRHE